MWGTVSPFSLVVRVLFGGSNSAGVGIFGVTADSVLGDHPWFLYSEAFRALDLENACVGSLPAENGWT